MCIRDRYRGEQPYPCHACGRQYEKCSGYRRWQGRSTDQIWLGSRCIPCQWDRRKCGCGLSLIHISIAFRNKKSKELFALLVDRKGGYVTSEEAVSFLWEDEPANTLTLSRYRKVALRLKSTLEEYGISGIVEAVDGKRRIVMDKVECDLYNYLSGKEEYSQLFKGSYLTNYSWGETCLLYTSRCV